VDKRKTVGKNELGAPIKHGETSTIGVFYSEGEILPQVFIRRKQNYF